MPESLYPRALWFIRKGSPCALTPGGWYAFAVSIRHGFNWRIDGYAAEDTMPGRFVRLMPAPPGVGDA